MGNEKRTYTREFKLEVLELLKTSGKPQIQLERELVLDMATSVAGKSSWPRKGSKLFLAKGIWRQRKNGCGSWSGRL
jgi:hypothetical protein